MSEIEFDIPMMVAVDLNNIDKHIKNPNKVVVQDKTITINFDYPFKDNFPFTFEAPNKDGFTRADLVNIIIRQYYKMYKIEDKSTQTPVRQHSTFCLNRNETDGDYGIWGHHMNDLSLDYMKKDNNDGTWDLGISS